MVVLSYLIIYEFFWGGLCIERKQYIVQYLVYIWLQLLDSLIFFKNILFITDYNKQNSMEITIIFFYESGFFSLSKQQQKKGKTEKKVF